MSTEKKDHYYTNKLLGYQVTDLSWQGSLCLNQSFEMYSIALALGLMERLLFLVVDVYISLCIYFRTTQSVQNCQEELECMVVLV